MRTLTAIALGAGLALGFATQVQADRGEHYPGLDRWGVPAAGTSGQAQAVPVAKSEGASGVTQSQSGKFCSLQEQVLARSTKAGHAGFC